jgi:hypothetical protein
MFPFAWCNVLVHMYICWLVPVRVRCMSCIERDRLLSFDDPMIKLW